MYLRHVPPSPSHPEITSSTEAGSLLLMQRIFEVLGQPRNYGPCRLEAQQERRRKLQERMRMEALDRAEEEMMVEEESRHREEHWEQWVGTMRRAGLIYCPTHLLGSWSMEPSSLELPSLQ